MKIWINQKEVNVTASDVENLIPKFTLRHGRRFTFLAGNGFKDVSLNRLILAVKNEAFKSEQNKTEIQDFLRVFNILQNKGYEKIGGQINRENILIRIITKIKHFFAEAKRKSLLKEFAKKGFSATENVKCIPKALDEAPINEPVKEPETGHVKRLPQVLDEKSNNESVKEPDSIDETKNYFKNLPREMKIEIIKKLDHESLFNFSRTNKENLNFVRDNNPNIALQTEMESLALEAWQEVCNRLEDLRDSRTKKFNYCMNALMKSYPTEVVEALDNTIEEALDKTIENGVEGLYDLPTIVEALEENTTMNPNDKLRLLEKIAVATSNPGILYFLTRAFASIDPARALTIANQISENSCKFDALAYLAGTFISINIEQAFNIANNIQNNGYNMMEVYNSILECAFRAGENAASVIKRIHDLVNEDENPNLIKSMWSNIAKAYTLSNNFERALELLQTIEENPRMMYSGDKHLLIDAYLDIVKKYAKSRPNDVISIVDKVLRLDTTEKTLFEAAKVCIELNLNKSKELAEQMQDAFLKIRLFVALAKKYKNIDKQISIQYLEQAIQLVDQINLIVSRFSSRDSRDVYALANIALCYASIDPNKAKELVERAELNAGMNVSGGCYRHDVVPSLAKAYLFIDSEHAIDLVNRYLSKHLKKAYVFLTLSKKLDV